MTHGPHSIGTRGEEIALHFLKKKGYKILCRNYRCPFGEIDIVAEHKGTLVFIEVKTRSSHTYGSPHEAVHLHKQRKISTVALDFIQRHRYEGRAARFDVVAVELSEEGPVVHVVENAFECFLR